jgi:hypothetical protein
MHKPALKIKSIFNLIPLMKISIKRDIRKKAIALYADGHSRQQTMDRLAEETKYHAKDIADILNNIPDRAIKEKIRLLNFTLIGMIALEIALTVIWTLLENTTLNYLGYFGIFFRVYLLYSIYKSENYIYYTVMVLSVLGALRSIAEIIQEPISGGITMAYAAIIIFISWRISKLIAVGYKVKQINYVDDNGVSQKRYRYIFKEKGETQDSEILDVNI